MRNIAHEVSGQEHDLDAKNNINEIWDIQMYGCTYQWFSEETRCKANQSDNNEAKQYTPQKS